MSKVILDKISDAIDDVLTLPVQDIHPGSSSRPPNNAYTIDNSDAEAIVLGLWAAPWNLAWSRAWPKQSMTASCGIMLEPLCIDQTADHIATHYVCCSKHYSAGHWHKLVPIVGSDRYTFDVPSSCPHRHSHTCYRRVFTQ